MKNKLAYILIVLVLVSCRNNQSENIKTTIEKNEDKRISTIQEKIANLKDSKSDEIIVVAHRGDWRNAPENSIQAIKNCIEMGVDMVEIDVRKTKDNQLVVIHDKTLDRTTTGKGLVSEWTLDSLKTVHLKNGANHTTHHKIPTLKEALQLAKGKILINLDKCYGFFDQAYKIMQETGTVQQVVLKGYDKTVQEVQNDLGNRLDSIIFMPIVNVDKQPNPMSIIEQFQKEIRPVAFEVVFSSDTSNVLNKFQKIKQNGSRVWTNTLWETLNAGYEDDMAIHNPDSIYGWHIKKGVNMIQTDRPAFLLDYLRKKGLHE